MERLRERDPVLPMDKMSANSKLKLLIHKESLILPYA